MDIAKLKKNFEKKVAESDAARQDLNVAIENFGRAQQAVASAYQELEHEETLEMARDLRQKK
jgi:hypothetical protein